MFYPPDFIKVIEESPRYSNLKIGMIGKVIDYHFSSYGDLVQVKFENEDGPFNWYDHYFFELVPKNFMMTYSYVEDNLDERSEHLVNTESSIPGEEKFLLNVTFEECKRALHSLREHYPEDQVIYKIYEIKEVKIT